MADKKNYNMFSEMGLNLNSGEEVDDMDVVEALKLDPSVAYTPQVNVAALDVVYARNVESHRAAGDSRQVARKKAHDSRKRVAASMNKAKKSRPK